MSGIYYIGDSIVAWNPSKLYPKFATPGHTTMDMLWDLKRHPEIKGELCLLALRVNDILYRYSLEESFQNYQALISLLGSRFSQIVLISLLPTDSPRKNQEIQKYNSFLESLAFPFLALYPLLLDSREEKIALKYTRDGTHLTRLGYEIVNKNLEDFVSSFHKEKEA